MRNFLQSGCTLTVIAPANVLGGQALLAGAIFGVACNDAVQGTQVEINRFGVYTLTAVTADTLAIGDKVYWDNTARRATKVATNNVLIGAAAAAKSGTETSANVLLDGAIR